MSGAHAQPRIEAAGTGGLKSPVTPIWRSCRPRTFASGVLSPLGPWIAATGRRQRTPPFRPPGPSPADPRSAAGRDVGRRSGLRSACAAVRLAPRLTPVRRRAGGPPQAAPPPIASRRDAARSPEPTARRPMRCRRSAWVSRVLGRRAPGAAPEGRPRQPARASAALRLLSIAIMPPSSPRKNA